MNYIDYEVPDGLKKNVKEFLKKVAEGGKLKKGMNESTKAIERERAELIVIAGDVDPPEIVYHMPLIAKEKNTPYTFLDTKEDLGKAVGLQVSCSAIAVTQSPSGAKDDLKKIVKQIEELNK